MATIFITTTVYNTRPSLCILNRFLFTDQLSLLMHVIHVLLLVVFLRDIQFKLIHKMK